MPTLLLEITPETQQELAAAAAAERTAQKGVHTSGAQWKRSLLATPSSYCG